MLRMDTGMRKPSVVAMGRFRGRPEIIRKSDAISIAFGGLRPPPWLRGRRVSPEAPKERTHVVRLFPRAGQRRYLYRLDQ
jgi:hypothetical protein